MATARAIELDSTDAHGYALRGIGVMHRGQLDRYPEALADARRAHEMNPNDTFVLRILGALEATAGEPERAIEHLHQVMRLNPRDPRSFMTYSVLAYASFGAKQYAEGIRWASRAINDRLTLVMPHVSLTCCPLGAGESDKAKAALRWGRNWHRNTSRPGWRAPRRTPGRRIAPASAHSCASPPASKIRVRLTRCDELLAASRASFYFLKSNAQQTLGSNS